MPGIVGIISQQPAYECESLVEAMVTSMAYERFYTSGTYAVPAMGIYSGWVAHKNSFAAGQVFFNEQKDIALIFGGECFLDPEALADLRQKDIASPGIMVIGLFISMKQRERTTLRN